MGVQERAVTHLSAMSIFTVHRVLIVCAIVLCLAFGLLELRVALERGGASAWVLAAIFSVSGIGLIVYLRNLPRILRGKGDEARRG